MKAYARETKTHCLLKDDTNSHAGRHTIAQVQEIQKNHSEGIKDKTLFSSARPGAKDKIRKAKISLKKRARQRLKRQMQNDLQNQLEII